MAIPRGLDHFSEFFKDFSDDFVIIGGGAASVYLGDDSLDFRATKDIDVVLFTNNSIRLNDRIADYIKAGGYDVKEKTDDLPLYYRFSSPKDKAYPEIIEFFSRNENQIELRQGQYIIPIRKEMDNQLSAILLDDVYFDLVKSNTTKSAKGYPIINPIANICLKARAFIELGQRGEDSKKQKKHLKDIVRLAQSLKAEPVALAAAPLADLQIAVDAIRRIPSREIKQINDINITKDVALDVLGKVFAIR